MPIIGRTSSAKPSLQVVAEELAATFESAARDSDGRIRVEDLLSTAAAVCGGVRAEMLEGIRWVVAILWRQFDHIARED